MKLLLRVHNIQSSSSLFKVNFSELYLHEIIQTELQGNNFGIILRNLVNAYFVYPIPISNSTDRTVLSLLHPLHMQNLVFKYTPKLCMAC